MSEEEEEMPEDPEFLSNLNGGFDLSISDGGFEPEYVAWMGVLYD